MTLNIADTPTPPMTPEQRAELASHAFYPGTVYAADQLEADGVTVATITAERDGLIDLAEDLSGGLFDANKELAAAQAEIARLTAALATAREDGMREAIDIAREEAAGLRVKAEAPELWDTQKVRWMAGAIQSDNIADYIEAAITKGATT